MLLTVLLLATHSLLVGASGGQCGPIENRTALPATRYPEGEWETQSRKCEVRFRNGFPVGLRERHGEYATTVTIPEGDVECIWGGQDSQIYEISQRYSCDLSIVIKRGCGGCPLNCEPHIAIRGSDCERCPPPANEGVRQETRSGIIKTTVFYSSGGDYDIREQTGDWFGCGRTIMAKVREQLAA